MSKWHTLAAALAAFALTLGTAEAGPFTGITFTDASWTNNGNAVVLLDPANAPKTTFNESQGLHTSGLSGTGFLEVDSNAAAYVQVNAFGLPDFVPNEIRFTVPAALLNLALDHITGFDVLALNGTPLSSGFYTFSFDQGTGVVDLTLSRSTVANLFPIFAEGTGDGDPIPEPTTLALLGMAISSLALRRRRRR